MDFLVILAILLLVAFYVSTPVRRAAQDPAPEVGAEERVQASEIAELEAAREAKLREILDADLDHRTGKLSDEDHRALDGGLRAEAIEILHRLDALRAPSTPDQMPEPDPQRTA